MKPKALFLLFSLFCFVFLLFGLKTTEAVSQTKVIKTNQQIEILKKELSLLKSLLLNLQSQREITAQSYLAINLSDNSVILEKNSNLPYSIASITKLMNAVIVLENVNTDQTIALTEKILEPFGQSPSLFLGLNINVKNLLRASLIQSTNDASEALAYFMGKEKFVGLMNQKAKEINMTNTFFCDPHGLNPANYSSASDLVKLLTYIYKNHPEILTITRDNDFWLPDPAGKLLKFQNVNYFYPLADFIGGKTGYLPEAKNTFASVFNVNGNQTAIILLYSKNLLADAFGILKQLKK